MGSTEVELARQIINKYPEVFESLLDYERTKKIPKLYRRKRLNVTIDENILRDFKQYARSKSLNISRFIEQRMSEELSKKI